MLAPLRAQVGYCWHISNFDQDPNWQSGAGLIIIMNLFIVLLVAVLGCVQPGLAVKQVAIVGGGVGGAASAYYLKSLLGDAVNITL